MTSNMYVYRCAGEGRKKRQKRESGERRREAPE
jgi:hypothetical protein